MLLDLASASIVHSNHPRAFMSPMRKFFDSTLGSKTVMAVTGLLLFGFLIVHMLGNLNMFAGPDSMNGYAKTLQDLGGLLWVARLGLLVIFAVHVFSAMRLTQLARDARPVPYVKVNTQAVTYASRTMIHSGLIVLAFLIYHLLHYTFGVVQADAYGLETVLGNEPVHDVYGMVVAGFSHPVVSLSYIVAMVVLSLHLCHGISSSLQTLGATHASLMGLKKHGGPVLATLIFIGFVSTPVAVLLGFIK